jgi:NADH-quinone oxidoreductase subunit L
VHGCVAAVLAGAGGVVLAYVFYLVKPPIPAAIQRALRASSTAAREQVLHGLVQRARDRAARRAAWAGLWKGGDVGLIDGILIDGSARDGGHFASVAGAAERLPLLVCAGDDRRRARPHDLAAVAVAAGSLIGV